MSDMNHLSGTVGGDGGIGAACAEKKIDTGGAAFRVNRGGDIIWVL